MDSERSGGRRADGDRTPRRYRVQIMPSATKEISALPRRDRERVTERINALAENPRPSGAVAMKGAAGYFRIRVGDYRVIYSIEDRVLRVLVVKVGNRRDVYRDF